MVPTARIGGEQGARLTRAAFALMIKFSDNFDAFLKLLEEVTTLSKDFDAA